MCKMGRRKDRDTIGMNLMHGRVPDDTSYRTVGISM